MSKPGSKIGHQSFPSVLYYLTCAATYTPAETASPASRDQARCCDGIVDIFKSERVAHLAEKKREREKKKKSGFSSFFFFYKRGRGCSPTLSSSSSSLLLPTARSTSLSASPRSSFASGPFFGRSAHVATAWRGRA